MDLTYILISAISCFLTAMGMGGGSVFIILGSIFLDLSQKTLQGLNLIMFISSGFTATILNLKNKMIDKSLCKKIIPFLVIGSIIGTYITSKIKEDNLRKIFLIFITIIGLYEIISSLISMKKGKNNNENNN